jgi:hypothetical protein
MWPFICWRQCCIDPFMTKPLDMWELCYDSTMGSDARTFHKRCDNLGGAEQMMPCHVILHMHTVVDLNSVSGRASWLCYRSSCNQSGQSKANIP